MSVETGPDMRTDRSSRKWCGSGAFILVGLALTDLVLHLSFSGRYGYFRDELYYMACGEHLAWGYVDQPPLIAVVAKLSQGLLGNSLFAIRFFPAVAGALVVFLTGWMARQLGGGRVAEFVAALAILLAPVYLAFDGFLSMNAFEPLFWTLGAAVVIRVLSGSHPRLWLLFGAVAGVGLLNKHTMLVFGFGVFVGLLLTPARRELEGKWIWLAGLIALAIFLPNLIWEARYHWPQIEVVMNARTLKNSPISTPRFLFEQVLFLQPITLPIWLSGLGWYFFSREGKRFRCLGWTFIVVLGIFILFRGKTYYPLPAYPMPMAAGAVAFEKYFAAGRRHWLVSAYLMLLILGGLVTLPFGTPVLPAKAFVRYSRMLPLARSVRTERDSEGPLPQLYADMFGWENMVATVAGVYHSLPAEDRTKCAILAGNYGEAGAIDLLGRNYGLPKPISGHNNYYLWGPRGYTGDVVILFGENAEVLKGMFAEVERAARISSPYAMPVENNLPVYVCRKPRASLQQLWPSLKYYI